MGGWRGFFGEVSFGGSTAKESVDLAKSAL